jgi:hypothetical protein
VAGFSEPRAQAIPTEDLAAAIFAILRDRRYPLVSIDRTPETPLTGRQRIRLEGVPRSSSFASQLVSADVLLKKAALGVTPAEGLPFASYFQMCVETARRGGREGRTASRLWFYALDPSLLIRDDVAAVRSLRVGVRTEVVAGAEGQDEVSDRFATSFTQHFDIIAARFPEVRGLKTLYECVAVAKGIESFPKFDAGFWVERFPLRHVDTPADYPVLRREERIESRATPHILEVEGGIDMRIFARRLREGDYTAFQAAVLGSRPSSRTLSWPVPLAGWRFMPDDRGPLDEVPEPAIGTSIESNFHPISSPDLKSPSSTLVDPRGGVKAEVLLEPNAFRRTTK